MDGVLTAAVEDLLSTAAASTPAAGTSSRGSDDVLAMTLDLGLNSLEKEAS